MPSQTDVQQLIQGLAPGSVNNGNPNTIYNTPQTVMGGGTKPVATQGTWFNNPIPAAANLPAVNLNLPVWQLPTWNASGGWNGSGPNGTGNPPGTGLPPGGNGGAGIGTGAGGLPDGGGKTGGQPVQGGNFFPDEQNAFNQYQRSLGSAMGTPGSDQWDRNAEWFRASYDRMSGAKNPDGSWDWRQLVDIITEPLMGGNIYLSGSNKWDASNAIASLIQSFTGIPLDNIMNKLGQWQATQNDPVDNWMEKLLADHWEDNANNDLRNFQDTLVRYMDNYADYRVGNQLGQDSNANANWLNKYGDYLAEAMLKGLKGDAASKYARDKANTDPRNTTGPNGSGGGNTGGNVGPNGGAFKGRDNDRGINEYAGSCVVVDSYLTTHERAGDVKVGDEMEAINAMTFETSPTEVTFSEPKLQPCVRVVTESGVVLECSRSAPIADDVGDQVRAENLLGYSVPVFIDGMIEFDTVVSVEDIGERYVQHITCGNQFFLAGKEKGKYLLHHNEKWFTDGGTRTSSTGWAGSGSIQNWAGLDWGW